MQLTADTLFANRYLLIKLLGRGGFSEVWLAKDSLTGLEVAIKVYAPGQGMDDDGLAVFGKEIANVYDMHHSNLLTPTHLDQWEGMPYLILPYCAKGSCFKYLGKLTEEQIWHLIYDVASGLAYLHGKEIIHQDIKPDNILIDANDKYVITDFGISTKARSTLSKSVLNASGAGSTAYMGPERFSRTPLPVKASDMWSLGATVYEIIEGVTPFGEIGGGMQKSGAEIPEMQKDVSLELRSLVESMLAKETWDRPTAEKVMEYAKPHLNSTRDLIINIPDSGSDTSMDNRPTMRIGANDSNFGTIGDVSVDENGEHDSATIKISQVPPPKENAWVKWVIGIISAIFVIVGISKCSAIQNEKEMLRTTHANNVREFDKDLDSASIDNIDALVDAYNNLILIQNNECAARYDGNHVYPNRHSQLEQKVTTIYNQIDGKYNRAPAGSDIERKLLQKRKRVQDIKNKL